MSVPANAILKLEKIEGLLEGRMKELAMDQIPGGRADNRPDSDFDPEELALGIEVEQEHTQDADLAKEIAKDHLSELPDYYSRLLRMEKEASHGTQPATQSMGESVDAFGIPVVPKDCTDDQKIHDLLENTWKTTSTASRNGLRQTQSEHTNLSFRTSSTISRNTSSVLVESGTKGQLPRFAVVSVSRVQEIAKAVHSRLWQTNPETNKLIQNWFKNPNSSGIKQVGQWHDSAGRIRLRLDDSKIRLIMSCEVDHDVLYIDDLITILDKDAGDKYSDITESDKFNRDLDDDDPYVDELEWQKYMPTAMKYFSEKTARWIMNYNSGGYGINAPKDPNISRELKPYQRGPSKVYRVLKFYEADEARRALKTDQIKIGQAIQYVSDNLSSSSIHAEHDKNLPYIDRDMINVTLELHIKSSDIFMNTTLLPKDMASLLHYKEEADNEVVLNPGSINGKIVDIRNKKLDKVDTVEAKSHTDDPYHWVHQPDPETLPNIPRMSEAERTAALAELAQSTVTKTAAGETQYLLHRGVDEGLMRQDVSGKTFKSKYRSAWTPLEKIATHFAKDRMKKGIVLSGWVPESAIVSIPKHFVKSSAVSKEYEVVIEAGKSVDIESVREVQVYRGNESAQDNGKPKITEAKTIEVFTASQVADSLKRGGREFESEDDLETEAQELAEFLNSFPHVINVYRVVHADSEDDVDADLHIGEHWTHTDRKAIEFARDNLKKPWFLISGKVRHGDVDWAQTLFQNVHHPHEEEIHVRKKKSVRVTSIEEVG